MTTLNIILGNPHSPGGRVVATVNGPEEAKAWMAERGEVLEFCEDEANPGYYDAFVVISPREVRVYSAEPPR